MTYIVFLGDEYYYYDKILKAFTSEELAINYAIDKVRELSNNRLNTDWIRKRFKSQLDRNDGTVDYLDATVDYNYHLDDYYTYYKFVGIKKLQDGAEL